MISRQFTSEKPQFANIKMNIEKIFDETGLMNFWGAEQNMIMGFPEMEFTQFSSWVTYP